MFYVGHKVWNGKNTPKLIPNLLLIIDYFIMADNWLLFLKKETVSQSGMGLSVGHEADRVSWSQCGVLSIFMTLTTEVGKPSTHWYLQ